MDWRIPGTVLTGDRDKADQARAKFEAMFLAGDIMLGQVSGISGLEPYVIQNWVRRGFLSPPKKKRYTLRQLCRILNINMLRGVLSMDRICSLLAYVNGQLDDDSDDMIDDTDLYFMFVSLASRAKELSHIAGREKILEEVLASYQEPVPGAKQRVCQVLQVMLTAWAAARIGQEADEMLTNLLENEQKGE